MAEGAANSGVDGARLRYEHALRALDRQANVLSDLRSRASIILSASGITASVFGAQAFQSGEVWLTGVALVVVFVGLVFCIAVLWPVSDKGPLLDPDEQAHVKGRRRWKATLTFADVRGATERGSEPVMLDALVALLEPAWKVNYETIATRSALLNWAAALLVVQVLAWSAALLAG